jgi:hypothetical protein
MTDDWCEWGQMPASMCQHCRDGKKAVKAVRAQNRDRSGEHNFTWLRRQVDGFGRASWDGKCRECDDQIFSGTTWVAKIGTDWMCASCARRMIEGDD